MRGLVRRGSDARGLVTSRSGPRGSTTVRATSSWDTFVAVLVCVDTVAGMVMVLPVRVVGEERAVDTIAGVLWRAVGWWAAVGSDWVRLDSVSRARPYRGCTRSCYS
jgi:hypothetical protein